ncbi:hypothetical protein FV242_05815 [Methylobacterium sp. WL64]|uniref:hypothetical protein n=1 Tax=Methylobacterium sp. WL64 TaxID=2603894 RepID=UPI0011CAD730|nr:hypothetical protein [Methylobacterium sp. WL64]TXN04869.1 hypothetical protein FV242_05815 [Methylobacterium sp. WL64]
MTDWLSSFVNLPAEYLKTIGTLMGGAFLAVGTYVVARIREARRPAEAIPGLPRLALDPADRDLGFTLVRTATDLTRALNDHADALANLPVCGGGPAPSHHRNRRNRP